MTRVMIAFTFWLILPQVLIAQTGWTKSDGNPVFRTGNPGAWDRAIVQHPWVIHEDGEYEMWYAGSPGAGVSIGYATFEEGDWVRRSSPVLTPEYPWEGSLVLMPVVLKRDGEYHMWYTTQPNFVIGYATSTNGYEWVKNPEPVMEPRSAWESASIMTGAVLFEDGIYKMWYSGSSQKGQNWQLGYATSDDGIEWTMSENAIYEDSRGTTYQAAVLKPKDTYQMWYTQPGDGSGTHIGYATSTDGLSWLEYGSNPVLRNSPGSWDAIEVQRPSVVLNTETNQLEMWYNGLNQFGAVPPAKIQIGRATSPVPNLQISGKIAFTSQRDGNGEIHVMDSDGNVLANLTNHGADEFHPSWSPDGNRIAFTSLRTGTGQIYVMDADGENQTNRTEGAGLLHASVPSWSPNGSKIAFRAVKNGQEDVYVMNSDGTGHTNLTNNPEEDGVPNWAPDGNKIVF